MKFKIIRNAFFDGLKSVQNIVPSKGSLPVLQNVLLEANEKKLKVTTSDVDISIVNELECEVIENGATTLPVKLLSNMIAKAAEGEIEVEIDSMERATIIAGSTKFKLSGMPEGDFPRLPNDEEAVEYKISQMKLKEMLRKVSYAASQDDTRRTLKCVLLSFKDSKMTMVATDGRRLALVEQEYEISANAERDIVLPFKAVNELQRSLGTEGDISIFVKKSQICFQLGTTMIYSKMMDEVYPNYKQVIPKETVEHISVDRIQLLNALDRVSVMTMDEAHSTRLVFSSGKLTVTSAANDVGEAKDDVPIKYAGETIEIIFNPAYVMDCLRAIDDDEIVINLNNGHSPAVITCSIPFIYVIMPLRIN